jgi:hypothetical protein
MCEVRNQKGPSAKGRRKKMDASDAHVRAEKKRKKAAAAVATSYLFLGVQGQVQVCLPALIFLVLAPPSSQQAA